MKVVLLAGLICMEFLIVAGCSSQKDILQSGGIRDEVDASYIAASSSAIFLNCLKEHGIENKDEIQGVYFAVLGKDSSQKLNLRSYKVMPNDERFSNKVNLCNKMEGAGSQQGVYEIKGDFPSIRHSVLKNLATEEEKQLHIELTPSVR